MVIIFFSGNAHKAQEISQILRNCEVRLYSEFVEKFSVEENGATFAQNAKIKLLGLKVKLEKSGFDIRQFGGRRVVLMAEDSGLCVEALDNLPHIFSARFASLPPLASLRDFTLCVESWQSTKDSTDGENIARLIRELKAKNLSESKAQFVSCVACCELHSSKDLSLKNQSARSANPYKSFCYFWLLPNEESPLPLTFNPPSNAQILVTHGFLNGKVITQIRGNNGFGYDPIFVPNGFSQTLGELGTEAKNALSHRANALKLMALLLK